MRILVNPNSVTLWLSANDTAQWVRKPGAMWPCSYLSGRRLVAVFDANGLCDVSIDGGRGDQDGDATEFNAITSDHLLGKVPVDHPAWFVAVGQFQNP